MKTPVVAFTAAAASVFTAVAEPRPAREVVARTAEGEAVEAFTLTNAHGLRARVITWGATLIEMSAPDREGKLAEVTLGFDDPARYLKGHPGFGNVVGRFANRIGGAKFPLEGRVVEVTRNSGANHIHGGARGFGARLWKGEPLAGNAVRFTYTAADGEEGFPGQVTARVTYALTDRDELRLEYDAVTDKPTVVNLTNHAYWNLAGRGDVLGHEMRLHASRFTVVDAALIPTGEIRAVAGTPLDFTAGKPIGRDIAPLQGEKSTRGYDHNFVIDAPKAGELTLAAEVRDPASGRVMRVLTTEPGVQIYSGNHLKNVAGRGGAIYGAHAGVCLETQHFPDSPNHPHFPTTTLRPGETFRSTTVFAFAVK